MTRQRINNFLQNVYYSQIITKKEQNIRRQIVNDIKHILLKHQDYVSLYVIGSSAYNLVMGCGDIDLVLLIKTQDRIDILNKNNSNDKNTNDKNNSTNDKNISTNDKNISNDKNYPKNSSYLNNVINGNNMNILFDDSNGICGSTESSELQRQIEKETMYEKDANDYLNEMDESNKNNQSNEILSCNKLTKIKDTNHHTSINNSRITNTNNTNNNNSLITNSNNSPITRNNFNDYTIKFVNDNLLETNDVTNKNEQIAIKKDTKIFIEKQSINEDLQTHKEKDLDCIDNKMKSQKENIVSNKTHKRNAYVSENSLFSIADLFKNGSFSIENILIKATFPIIKLRSRTSNIMVDISINQYSAIENTNLIAKVLSNYPFIKQTIVIVKTICRAFNINCSYTCTLSSYAITLMTIFYFQMIMDIPHIFSKNKSIINEFDIFDNVRGFFFFYGWIFDYKNDVISVRLAKMINKSQFRFRIYNEKYSLHMCVEDPIVSDFNVTRTVTKENLGRIVKVFRIVYYMLSNYDTSFL